MYVVRGLFELGAEDRTCPEVQPAQGMGHSYKQGEGNRAGDREYRRCVEGKGERNEALDGGNGVGSEEVRGWAGGGAGGYEGGV